nr:PREDICTED: cathepsin L 2-like [Bemisia tabaci]
MMTYACSLLFWRFVFATAVLICLFKGVEVESQDGAVELALMQQFEQFMVEHEKVYDSLEEKMRRFEIFKDNLKKIEELNADPEQTAIFGVNVMADLTREEFRATYLTYRMPDDRRENFLTRLELDHEEEEEDEEEWEGRDGRFGLLKSTKKPKTTTTTYPPPTKGPPPQACTIDWRKISPNYPSVDDQKQCGSCWAFASVGAFEVLLSKSGKTTKLSKQELVDCTKDNAMCEGGWFEPAFKVMENPGLCAEKDYKYTAKNGTCKSKFTVIEKLKSFKDVSGTDSKLIAALPTSPLPIAMNCNDDMQWYVGGVMISKYCPANETNHAVVIVGLCGDAWRIRNSWGTKWGVEQGHIYVKRGTCGIGGYAYQLFA